MSYFAYRGHVVGDFTSSTDVCEQSTRSRTAVGIAECGLHERALRAKAGITTAVEDVLSRTASKIIHTEDDLDGIEERGLARSVRTGRDIDPIGSEIDRISPQGA